MDAITGHLWRDAGEPSRGFGGHVISGAEIAALKAHPQFDQAWRQAAVAGIKQYRGVRLLNGLINDRGRDTVALLALYLHRTASPGDARSGLTVSRLKAICADQDIASPGRIEALLMLMRAAGLLRPLTAASDHRVRRLAPTERLTAMLHERWDGVLAAMTPIFPEAAAARTALADEAFERALVQRFGATFLTGFRLMDDPESMGVFTERNGGLMVVFSLVTAGEPGAPVPVSISALARHFSVSRPHVRKMLHDAADAGYIACTDTRQTQVLVLLPLYDAVQTFFAKAFLFLHHCIGDVRDELAAAHGTGLAQGR